jgi:hypothetical protein
VPADSSATTDRRNLVRSLDAADGFADSMHRSFAAAPAKTLGARLGMFAEAQLKNNAAVAVLEEMSSGGRGRYLSADSEVDLTQLLPGVSLTVLGPPLPDKWPAVRREKADDSQYWFGLAQAIPSIAPVDDDARLHLDPGPVSWLADQLHGQSFHSAMRIVRTLDRALNNTSLILLFEVGNRSLLFPGDAQIENWSYTFARPDRTPEELAAVAAKLGTIDFYKVGHHGSRNATPKLSLEPLWRTTAAKPPLSYMSTLPGVYDDSNPVPAAKLIEALTAAPLTLVRSDQLASGAAWSDAEFDIS